MNLGYPYFERARQVQSAVRHDEFEMARKGLVDYTTNADVRLAIVHARQDLVLVVSLLDSLDGQVRVIRWLLCALLAAVLFGLFR